MLLKVSHLDGNESLVSLAESISQNARESSRASHASLRCRVAASEGLVSKGLVSEGLVSEGFVCEGLGLGTYKSEPDPHPAQEAEGLGYGCRSDSECRSR